MTPADTLAGAERSRMIKIVRAFVFSGAVLFCACSTGRPGQPNPPPYEWDGGEPAAEYDANVKTFCDLPGSVRNENGTKNVVAGAKGLPDLSWLDVPQGFCAHFFAMAPNARSIRFAPGGELFATSPSRGTTGGGPGGKSAILVLPDDNRDGLADSANPIVSNVDATQGILFTKGSFYYQDDARILQMPYEPGQRAPKPTTLVADLGNRYKSSVHWPKSLDVADDGTIYVANGSDQGEDVSACNTSRPFRGGIFAIGEGKPMDGEPIIKGFRNPIAVRCQRGHGNCFTTELTRDYSWSEGGREKLVPIRKGDDWGYPCCATQGFPFPDVQPTPDCSFVSLADVVFWVADTPFGFDFEPGRWPAPWTNRVFVTLHGQFGTWIGARIIAIETDSSTGMPKPGGTFKGNGGGTTGAALDFATGWDDGKLDRGRPSDLTFAQDGRMFVAHDNGPAALSTTGIIVWFAPLDLPKP